MRDSEYNPIITTHKMPIRERSASIEIRPPMDGHLGTGFSATVLKAMDRDLGREIAYKELRGELNQIDEIRDFFVYEGQITAQLDHPNIVPIHELGRCPSTSADGKESLYLIMKRIRGRTLLNVIEERESGPLGEDELFSLLQSFLKVCDAVGFAHSRGVIHRDLKPDNIMLGDYGEVYVVDWGIAMVLDDKVERTKGPVVGTPAYMSPEQAEGRHDKVDKRSDIYCLGGCLYELLTGCAPHVLEDDSIEKTLAAAKEGNVVPPQDRVPFALPVQLCKVMTRAMAKNPADRYQDAVELKNDIENFLRTYSFFPRATYEEGEIIVSEGDEGNSMFIIVEGTCEVFKTVNDEKTHLRELGSGDVLGEIAVFTKRRRTASVRALTPVTAVQISRDQIMQGGDHGYWISLFTKALAERFLKKERQVEALETRLDRIKKNTDLPPR